MAYYMNKNVPAKRGDIFYISNSKADFLQRALGYSMLGMSNEECMFILHGKTTRNGTVKGVIL